MTWRGIGKAVAMFVLVWAGVGAIVFGGVQLLFGRPWWRLWGLFLMVGGFRIIIFAMDFMMGRPPAWSRYRVVREASRTAEGYKHH